MFQLLPIKEKIINLEVIRMRSGYIFDTLTLVDFCEIGIMGGKGFQITKEFFIEITLNYLLLENL